MSRFPSLPQQPLLVMSSSDFRRGDAPAAMHHDVILQRSFAPHGRATRTDRGLCLRPQCLRLLPWCAPGHRRGSWRGRDHPRGPGQRSSALGVEARLLPILAYVRKLTLTPSRMVDADAAAVFDAGWSEEALFHAISVCALFSFMNRIVRGSGFRPMTEYGPNSVRGTWSSRTTRTRTPASDGASA